MNRKTNTLYMLHTQTGCTARGFLHYSTTGGIIVRTGGILWADYSFFLGCPRGHLGLSASGFGLFTFSREGGSVFRADGSLAPESTNTDPFDILREKREIHELDALKFLRTAEQLFTDKIQVDWGSFAYRCTKEQLELLQTKTGCVIEGLDAMNTDAEYGIIFIEIY